MISFNWSPTERQLRQFGGVAVVALPALAWLWTRDVPTVQWSLIAGATLCSAGFVKPQLLKPVFIGLSLLFFPVGIVVSEIALIMMFFCVLTPVALFFRLTGRDVLHRKIDRSAESYFSAVQPTTDLKRYYRQS
ncbi:MAG: hypothetical protein KDA91_11895 [Planctomycetaceae bacterium]|nr:hypothetical protein [Planctomycetaceae bacterium]